MLDIFTCLIAFDAILYASLRRRASLLNGIWFNSRLNALFPNLRSALVKSFSYLIVFSFNQINFLTKNALPKHIHCQTNTIVLYKQFAFAITVLLLEIMSFQNLKRKYVGINVDLSIFRLVYPTHVFSFYDYIRN